MKCAEEPDRGGGRVEAWVGPSAFVCRDKPTSVHDDKPAVRHVGVRPALAKSLTSRELGCCRSRLLSQPSSGSVLFSRAALIRSLSCRISSSDRRLDFKVVSAGNLLYGSVSGNAPRCSSSTPGTPSSALSWPVSRRLCRPVLGRHSPVLGARFFGRSVVIQAEGVFFCPALWVNI